MMELPFSFSMINTFLLMISFLIIMLLRAKHEKTNKKLPPGPWKLPLIGNLHHLVMRRSPLHHRLRELAKKHGDLMHLQAGKMSMIVVSSPKMAKEVIKTNDLIFANRYQRLISKLAKNSIGRSMARVPYGDYLRQMRNTCISELLGNKKVRSFSSLRQAEASNLIESIRSSSNSPINLTEKIFLFTTAVLSTAAFGSKCEEDRSALMLSHINKLTALDIKLRLVDMLPCPEFVHVISGLKAQVLKSCEEAYKVVDNIIIDKHREKKEYGEVEREREDLVDVLLRLQNSGSDHEDAITSNDVKAIVMDMFAAGVFTSATTTIWAMVEMMKNPEVMKKAQDELREVFKGKERITETDLQQLNYLKLVIKETLRLHPAFPCFPRECREDCEINGYKIPKKTFVLINVWAIGRDPGYWENAESFIPERFSNCSTDFRGNHFEFIPFGAGRRMCPGISFAISNMELSLALLLYHFNWALPDGIESKQLDMSEDFHAVAAMKNGLYFVATPYVHPPLMTPDN